MDSILTPAAKSYMVFLILDRSGLLHMKCVDNGHKSTEGQQLRLSELLSRLASVSQRGLGRGQHFQTGQGEDLSRAGEAQQ